MLFAVFGAMIIFPASAGENIKDIPFIFIGKVIIHLGLRNELKIFL